MRSGFRRGLEWILLDTHIWVSAAAAGLTLFAASALGLPQRLAPMGAVFSATMLIYAVDDIFDGRMRSQPGRWLTVLLGAGSLSGQLLLAPVVITVTVEIGSRQSGGRQVVREEDGAALRIPRAETVGADGDKGRSRSRQRAGDQSTRPSPL